MASYSKYLLSLLPLFYCSACAAYSKRVAEPQPTLPTLESTRAEVRHIENKGVGYKTGYTTLEIFLAPSPDWWTVMPFLDLRGHVFDDGRFGSNMGIGFRKPAGCRVYGFNTYWDYRKTKRAHYNQVGFGFETLGADWDFRFNGYLPVGAKTSRPFDVDKKSTVNFATFRGNNALIEQNTYSKHKLEYAMKGFDAEAAFHVIKNKNFDFFPAIGPYVYQFRNKQAFGGRLRFSANIFQYLSLDLITTYDNRFHTNVQGSIGINIPLGPKFNPSVNARFSQCQDSYYLYERMLQNVIRQEIVVVDKLHRRKVSSDILPAINPATGLPYVFYFVDNTSHSAGTYESPFHTLQDAQAAASPGNIIYVFPGDGTSNNMNQGITLSSNQSLLGAATVHLLPTTLGNVQIPALAQSLPVITNNTGPVVTLSGNNTLVSGFYIENNNGNGIQGNNINNVSIASNTIIGNNNDGINLQDIGGTVLIDSNVFTQSTTGSNYGARLTQTTAQCNPTFSNNTFYGYGVHMGGISTQLSGTGSINTLSAIGNRFFGNNSNSESAINIDLIDTSSIGTLNLQNNQSSFFYYGTNLTMNNNTTLSNFISTGNNFGNYRNGYVGIYVDMEDQSSLGTISISDCNLSSNGTYGASIYSNSTGSLGSFTMTNTILNEGSYGLALEFDNSGGLGNVQLSNCTMNAHYNGSGMYLNLGGSGSVNSFNVDSCTIQGNTNSQALTLNLFSSGSIGQVSITNSNLNNNPNGGVVIYASLTGSGSIGDMNVSNCSLMYNDNAYAILAAGAGTTGTINNLKVENCHLDYSFNGGGIQVDGTGSSTINNLTIVGTSITNSQNDVYINLSNSSINTISVSNVDASNNAGFALTANLNNSTIGSLEIDNFTALSNTNGIKLVLDSTSSVNTCSLSNLSINGSQNSDVECTGGSFNNLQISDSSLANANSAGINLTSAVSSLTINNCVLQFNNIGIYTTATTDATFTNNSLQNSASQGLSMTTSSGSASYAITGNKFSGVTTPAAGYGSNITVNGGSLCLDFSNNQAMPSQDGAFAPYTFTQTSGTFDLTSASTQANNVGTISTSGTVGAPGSCTQ